MKRKYSMLQGPLLPSIISYTIPIILTSILQLLFNAADLIVVGQHCGSISVAAVGATGSLTSLLVNFFVGFSVGEGATMANAIGSRDDKTAHRIVHTAIPTALVCGGVLTVVGVCFSETFLIWMGTPENVLPLSAVYMKIYFGGILFTMVYNFSAAILRAAGDTKSPLLFLSISGVVNVLLNLLFVKVFHMDVAGVALATTISQAISAALTVLALTRRIDACKLRLHKMRFYGPQLAKIVSQGLPAGIQSSLFSISNTIIQSSVNSFGDVLMSGNAAAQNIEGFVYVSMDAFSQTAINFTGQNAGAGQYPRIKKILWMCLVCVAVVGFAVGGGAYLLAPQLLSIYIPDSSESVAWGIIRMLYLCVPYFICGMMNVTTGVLRGMGASVAPMVISILGACGLRVAWIYTVFQIPAYHTPESLYVSYPISWIVTFLAQFVVCLIVYRRRMAAHTQALKLEDQH
ncbi:MAG: MATE family efflux transporter [Ruminococcaceae bacterium]|nr:MATE family efflux transporter [Oscillospiraceae bacterium]